jgi:hypothetical protein
MLNMGRADKSLKLKFKGEAFPHAIRSWRKRLRALAVYDLTARRDSNRGQKDKRTENNEQFQPLVHSLNHNSKRGESKRRKPD